jgi:hypothetical protein
MLQQFFCYRTRDEVRTDSGRNWMDGKGESQCSGASGILNTHLNTE